jgi:hypothetical protein
LFAALLRRGTKPLTEALFKKHRLFAEVIYQRRRGCARLMDWRASINRIKLIAAAASRIADARWTQVESFMLSRQAAAEDAGSGSSRMGQSRSAARMPIEAALR